MFFKRQPTRFQKCSRCQWLGMRGVRSPIRDVAAVLHRQATIRMAVYRPAKIPSPLTSYSDSEIKQYTVVKPSTTRIQPSVRDRAVAERLFGTPPGIQVNSYFYPRKNLKNLPFDLAPASLSVSRLGLCSVGPLANQRPYSASFSAGNCKGLGATRSDTSPFPPLRGSGRAGRRAWLVRRLTASTRK